MRFARRIPPCAIVIFGASGDLSKRKLLPSLYRLFYERRISPNFAVIGSSRTPMSDDQFREKMKESVSKFLEEAPFDEDVWKSFAQCLFYVPGDLNNPASYDDLRERWMKLKSPIRRRQCSVLLFHPAKPLCRRIEELGAHNLHRGNGWRRVIIEKPFGHDLTSARKLNEEIHKVFDESDDLPDRPLSGQRNRSEHSGFPLRQRHFRAALEPPVCGPCADHGSGIASAWKAAAAITRKRARCAT